jgi:hypothetical protein
VPVARVPLLADGFETLLSEMAVAVFLPLAPGVGVPIEREL